MIKRVFTQPLEWAKRHWIILLLLALLLYLLSTFFFYLYTLFKRIGELAARFLPAALAGKLSGFLTLYFNWVTAHPWLFVLGLLLFYPPLGWLILAWLLIDRLKGNSVPGGAGAPASPAPAPEAPAAAGGITDYRDYIKLIPGLFGF